MRTRTTLAGIAVWLLCGGIATQAAYTVPAVNLPAQTPDIVRDRVARSLAFSRDQVGRALHPFRGEFHGLGAPAGRGSYAVDLSGDGRVVVGFDRTGALGSQVFVWSPATGRTPYNLLPSGAVGYPSVAAISADGVYVGGSALFVSRWGNISFSSTGGVLWSLAGSQSIADPSGRDLHVASLSGDGKVVVGARSDFGSVCSCSGSDKRPELWAYRYARGGSVQEVDRLATEDGGYYVDSMAVDVTSDGQTVLVNGMSHNVDGRAEPFLWTADGALKGLGRYNEIPVSYPYYPARTTTGRAISADGSTVVGYATDFAYLYAGESGYGPTSSAILWREESGWVDLGQLETTADKVFIGANASHVSGDGGVVLGKASLRSFNLAWEAPTFDISNVPFHWDEARGMRELTAVLQLDYGLDLSGWTLTEATGISDDGTTIIGNGRNPAGQTEAWRAVLNRSTPLGDIDFDGDVDQWDYQRLAGNLGVTAADGAVFYADGDLNADGRVDQLDAATLLGLYQGRKQGDFNADGVVNIADYTVWRDHLGQFTGGVADSNGDGWVNQADLAVWRAHFGRAIGAFLPLSIPEPATATLLAAAALAALSRRR